ncbi:hypothetical protein ACJJTC_018894 [Scirpophaga incertulas]
MVKRNRPSKILKAHPIRTCFVVASIPICLRACKELCQTVSESARVKISATRVDSKNERGEWRLWRAPRAVRSGWRSDRSDARPGRAARPPSPRVTSSERLRARPNLPDDRTSEPREKEIVLVVGFLSDAGGLPGRLARESRAPNDSERARICPTTERPNRERKR